MWIQPLKFQVNLCDLDPKIYLAGLRSKAKQQLQKRFYQQTNTKMNPYGDGSPRLFKTENWSLNLYLGSFHMIAFTSVLKSESKLVQPRYWSSRASLEENTTFYSESGSYVPLSIFQNQVFPVNVYSLSKILPSKVNLCPVMRVMC